MMLLAATPNGHCVPGTYLQTYYLLITKALSPDKQSESKMLQLVSFLGDEKTDAYRR